MAIIVVGISYKKADTALRSRLAMAPQERLEAAMALLNLGLDEVVILSTCNRLEIIMGVSSNSLVEANVCQGAYGWAVDLLEAKAGHSLKDLIDTYENKQAFSHLFALALGLESQVIGETEILGQLKAALLEAQQTKTSGKYLNFILRSVITFAKARQSQFKVAQQALSLTSLVAKHLVEMPMHHVALGCDTPIEDRKILILGSGALAKKQVLALRSAGFRSIQVATRRLNLYKEIEKWGGHPCDFSHYYGAIEQADIIIALTSAKEPLVEASKVSRSHKKRIFIDLAIPRNIEDQIGNDPQNLLFHIDFYNQRVQNNLQTRLDHAQVLKAMVPQAVDKLEADVNRLAFDPIIVGMHKKRRLLLQDNKEKLIQAGLEPHQVALITSLLDKSVWSLMKGAIAEVQGLRSIEDIHRFSHIVDRIFTLGGFHGHSNHVDSSE